MTRQDFLELETWDDILNVCAEYDLDICQNVYYDEDRDELIEERLRDFIRENDWVTTRNMLDNIPTDYQYYILDDWGDWSGTEDGDDTWQGFKDEILEYMDENELWDVEGDGEDRDEETQPEQSQEDDDDTEFEAEDFTVEALFASSQNVLRSIDEVAKAEEAEEDAQFYAMVGSGGEE